MKNIEKKIQKNKKPLIFYIPNILTISRLVLVVLIIILTIIIQVNYSKEEYNRIFALFLIITIGYFVASLTDYFDGWFARKFKCTSNFGKIADPIADKILNLTILLVLVFLNTVVVVYPIMFLARDLLITKTRQDMVHKNIIISANMLGKIKTIVLFVLIMFVLIVCCYYLKNSDIISINHLVSNKWFITFNVLFIIPLFLAYYSLLSYFKISVKKD